MDRSLAGLAQAVLSACGDGYDLLPVRGAQATSAWLRRPFVREPSGRAPPHSVSTCLGPGVPAREHSLSRQPRPIAHRGRGRRPRGRSPGRGGGSAELPRPGSTAAAASTCRMSGESFDGNRSLRAQGTLGWILARLSGGCRAATLKPVVQEGLIGHGLLVPRLFGHRLVVCRGFVEHVMQLGLLRV